MKKLLLAFSLLTSMTFASQAQAFFIEPFVGYALSGDIGTTTTNDVSGVDFGLRVGSSTLGFLYGLEYNVGKFVQTVPASANVDVDSTNIGVVIGYEFPILLRAWLTYNISTKLTTNLLSKDYEGSGYKLGVGYTGLPFLVVGVEMIKYTYDKFDGASISPDLALNATMLTVSIPLP